MINIDIALKNGTIVFDDFDLDDKKSLLEQLDSLKEDMLQIEFFSTYLIDVGWYPCFDIHGEFRIYLIKNQDWENEVYFGKAKDVTEVYEQIKIAISNIPPTDR